MTGREWPGDSHSYELEKKRYRRMLVEHKAAERQREQQRDRSGRKRSASEAQHIAAQKRAKRTQHNATSAHEWASCEGGVIGDTLYRSDGSLDAIEVLFEPRHRIWGKLALYHPRPNTEHNSNGVYRARRQWQPHTIGLRISKFKSSTNHLRGYLSLGYSESEM